MTHSADSWKQQNETPPDKPTGYEIGNVTSALLGKAVELEREAKEIRDQVRFIGKTLLK